MEVFYMSKNKSGFLNAKELAKEAALEAIKTFKQQEKDQVKKRRLHNTGLLLENYLDFLDYYNSIKYKAEDIQDSLDPVEFDVVYIDDIFIDSIKRSKVRTMIIIKQIETAVEKIQEEMTVCNEVEKYNAVNYLYFKKELKDLKFNSRVSKVAELLNCSESSVRRWNNEVLKKLSVMLFGVDGMRIDL